MGVHVRFDDLSPHECDGSTYERHCEVVKAVEDQVVAIDASQVDLFSLVDDLAL